MALENVMVGGKSVLVEVAELEMEGGAGAGFEYTALSGGDVADHIRDLVGALTAPVRAAFEGAGAEEWSLGINFGFKGETGVPFIAKGEANAAVKVTAKWKK
jgi:hypothetical protein